MCNDSCIKRSVCDAFGYNTKTREERATLLLAVLLGDLSDEGLRSVLRAYLRRTQKDTLHDLSMTKAIINCLQDTVYLACSVEMKRFLDGFVLCELYEGVLSSAEFLLIFGKEKVSDWRLPEPLAELLDKYDMKLSGWFSMGEMRQRFAEKVRTYDCQMAREYFGELELIAT